MVFLNFNLADAWSGRRAIAAMRMSCFVVALWPAGCGFADEEASADVTPPTQFASSSRPPAEVEQSVSALPPQALPGGETTFLELSPLSALSADALSQPFGNLTSEERLDFVVGNSFFTNPWVAAGASTAGRDGLGPLYSAAACQDCHIRDGRGHAPAGPDEFLTSAVVRLALADGQADPVYGRHLQTRAVPGLAPEARVSVRWQESPETLPDGSVVTLRRPELVVTDWAYGEADAGLRLSLRVAPAVIGMGLLEAIPPADLRAYAELQRRDGLVGRVQAGIALAGEPEAIGRFGWKATQSSVEHQALDAFANDIGITSSRIPNDVCTETQLSLGCADFPSGGQPELSRQVQHAVVFYARHLAPPVRRQTEDAEVKAGEHLFTDIGCSGCHKPSWRTGDSPSSRASANQLIWPYTDLLLHDMGIGLADGHVEGLASGRHWRTTPLWGLGQVKAVGGERAGYLHDGRARTIAEAILWHGGEAQRARDAWAALPERQRALVLSFLKSL